MNNGIFEPLGYYQSTGREKHLELTSEYFEELVKKSEINVEENRRTVRAYKAKANEIDGLNKKISKYKTLRTLIIVGMIIAAIASIVAPVSTAIRAIMIAVSAAGIILGIIAIVKKINPVIKDFSNLLAQEKQKAEAILAEARAQTAPLNALFRERDVFNIIEKTIPDLKFDTLYTTEQDRIFKTKNDFVDITDEDSSVTDVLSGTYMDNPFLFQRIKEHVMGSHTYHGERVISWIEYYTDSNGKRCSRRRYQTLYASVTKPKPDYYSRTYLHYGAQGAPDLSFSRENVHIEQKSEKAIQKMVRQGSKELRKKAEDAVKKGGNFTELANSEFDVLFGATDRNNEVQFRMMYTPLAQIETVKLLKSNVGYGDDFDFFKNGRMNTIVSEHGQNWNMSTAPENYYHYDVDEIKTRFITINTNYFKSVFFDFAPLLAVPMYQQRPVKSLEDISEPPQNYTGYEYECLANAIPSKAFAHSETETDVIVKAVYTQKHEKTDSVRLTAYSYKTIPRVDHVPVLGGDGRLHPVPVMWKEYVPISRTTSMAVREFGSDDREISQNLGNTVGNELSRYAGRSGFNHGLFGFILKDSDSTAHLESLAQRYISSTSNINSNIQ